MGSEIDSIYANPMHPVPEFRFDEQVARVFDDMIHRSVPGYATALRILNCAAARALPPRSRIYDLGCSLAAATAAVAELARARKCELIAVDNSADMLTRAQKKLDESGFGEVVELVCADIRDIEIDNAGLVILNLTLQFLPVPDRTSLITKIADGLVAGGELFLFEKIAFDNPAQQSAMTDLYYAFKAANGYSELEISQKRSALEDTLITETAAAHEARLRGAGFGEVIPVFHSLGFAGWIARKPVHRV